MSGFNHMPYLHVPPPMVRPAMGSLEAPPIPPPMVRPAMGSLEAPPIVPSHLQGNVYSIEQQQDNYLYNMMACASEMAVKKALEVVVHKPLEEIKALLTEIKVSLQSNESSEQILKDQAKDLTCIKEAVEDNYKKVLNKATKLKEFKTSMEALIKGLEGKVSKMQEKMTDDDNENNKIDNLIEIIQELRKDLNGNPFNESLSDIKVVMENLVALNKGFQKLGNDLSQIDTDLKIQFERLKKDLIEGLRKGNTESEIDCNSITERVESLESHLLAKVEEVGKKIEDNIMAKLSERELDRDSEKSYELEFEDHEEEGPQNLEALEDAVGKCFGKSVTVKQTAGTSTKKTLSLLKKETQKSPKTTAKRPRRNYKQAGGSDDDDEKPKSSKNKKSK